MGGDLPDYSRKVIVVYEGTITAGEVKCDHWKIKGLTLKDPYIALSIPMSVENPALAYDAVNDRFKIVLEAITAGVIPVSLTSIPNPPNLDVALSTRATGTLLNPHPVSLASIPNPSNLDIAISLLSRETTLAAMSAKITNPLPVSLSTLLNPHPVTQTNETLLKATVTQAAKDRTVSSVDATATAVQISLAALNGDSAALITPAAGKAVRIKFISLYQSANVNLGYRFGAAGTIYYLRGTLGTYVSNLIGCNNQGAADATLILNSSGATNVKGYIMYQEV
jgi:hypothetical protein